MGGSDWSQRVTAVTAGLGEMNVESFVEVERTSLDEGFALAEDAVANDKMGEHLTALSLYRISAKVFQSALDKNPTAPNADQLIAAISTSNGRVAELEAMLRDGVVNLPVLDRPPRPPLDSFLVLSRVAASIADGTWMTPQVYVPAELWYDLSNVSDIPAKVIGLSAIIESFETAQRKLTYKHHPGEVLNALQRSLRAVRKDLARDLSYVQEEVAEAKKEWSFGDWTRSISESISTKTASAASVGGGAAYVQLLARVCDKVALWHPTEESSPFWMLQNTGDAAGAQQALEKFSEFLREVVCVIALHDVRKLYSQFLKAEKQAFDRHD